MNPDTLAISRPFDRYLDTGINTHKCKCSLCKATGILCFFPQSCYTAIHYNDITSGENTMKIIGFDARCPVCDTAMDTKILIESHDQCVCDMAVAYAVCTNPKCSGWAFGLSKKFKETVEFSVSFNEPYERYLLAMHKAVHQAHVNIWKCIREVKHSQPEAEQPA